MGDILFLKAPLVSRIWGGQYFNKTLHLTPLNDIGEMWCVSSYKGLESIITNGKYKGYSLSKIYCEHKELFNDFKNKEFPLLIKVIATSDDLSVQVHPDDNYAKIHENQNGKMEGWLILDESNSFITIGHNANNKDQLLEYIKNDDYDNLLNKKKVTKGEFYPINPGTIHAIGKNIVLLEIQQSSDVTYRFYDYHRKDKFGNERQLHIDKAVAVTSYEKYDYNSIRNHFDNIDHVVWENDYFIVKIINVIDEYTFKDINSYLTITIIDGTFKIRNHFVKFPDSFIICNNVKIARLIGNGKVIVTIVK